jgi:hypothetical protein
MVRRGDDDGVDIIAFDQFAEVGVRFGSAADFLLGPGQNDLLIDVAHRDDLHVVVGHEGVDQLTAAVRDADEPEPDSLVRARQVCGSRPARCGSRGRQSHRSRSPGLGKCTTIDPVYHHESPGHGKRRGIESSFNGKPKATAWDSSDARLALGHSRLRLAVKQSDTVAFGLPLNSRTQSPSACR